MMRSQKPRTKAELFLRTGGIVAITLCVFALAVGSATAAYHMFQREQDATDAADAATKQLATLRSQESQVQGDIANLSSARGVEAALRERYGVAKPGEGIIEVVQSSTSSNDSASAASDNIFVHIFHALFSW